VESSSGAIGAIQGDDTMEWKENTFEITPEALGSDRQITFIIEGSSGDGIFDQIIINGDSNRTTCDPNDCTYSGFCHSFDKCTPAGTLENTPCPMDSNGHSLWWNPDKNPETWRFL